MLADAALYESTTPDVEANSADLFRYSRELHNMEGLVVGGSTLVDVDNHGGFSSAAEKSLEQLGQLALPEGDVGALHPDAEEF